MNLWTKSVGDINFADVQEFCKQNLPEGTRLDYKSELKPELDKLICAFANSHGGIIIIGVESNKLGDTPIWPDEGPCGIPAEAGLELRVQQTAATAIYPPVPVQVSRPLPIPGKSDIVLLVVRVDPSPDAPHAIDKNRRVYERTGNRVHPNELVDIDRLRFLLTRRERAESNRASLIDADLERAMYRLPFAATAPYRWISIAPMLVSRNLATPEKCWEMHHRLSLCSATPQRIPGGSIGMMASHNLSTTGAAIPSTFSSVNARGHVFSLQVIDEAVVNRNNARLLGRTPAEDYFELPKTKAFWSIALKFAARFYCSATTERPGFISIVVGLAQVRNSIIINGPSRSHSGFIDPNYRDSFSVSLDEWTAQPDIPIDRLADNLWYGFDVR
jgi:hypothetical protein